MENILDLVGSVGGIGSSWSSAILLAIVVSEGEMFFE